MTSRTEALETAEQRLDRLLDRLLSSGESAAAAGEWDQARAAAEDVLTVDPGNQRAGELLERAGAAERDRLGERALMTILFSDLVDSTPMAERIDPEAMRDIFGLYRNTARTAIERFGGTIVQFLGDGIVAAFGYPTSHEDDARRAVLGGLDLLTAMEETRKVALERHELDVRVRVGIHTGLVVVGELGEGPGHERHSIVGVTPNMASRLQSEAEPGMLVISDVTHHLVASDFETRSLGARNLKGVSRPVEIYAVAGSRHVGSRLASPRYKGRFVGREQELAKLSEAWKETRAVATATSGTPVPAICIVGDPGMGKSRLVAEILGEVLETGGDVLEVECLAYYSDIPFYPMGQMLRHQLGIREADSADHSQTLLAESVRGAGVDVPTALPLLAPLIGLPDVAGYSVPELEPAAVRQLTISLLAQWLGHLEQGRPRLLVAEDVETADPSTSELIGRLASEPPPGLLTVMTSREPLSHSWVDRVETSTLGPLTSDEAATLITSITDTGLVSADLKESILERAEGIPLFVEELVYSALESPSQDPVPLRLQEVLTARLRTPGVDLRSAQIAATAGFTFDEKLIEAVVEKPETVSSRLDAMVSAGIVDPMGDGGRSLYRFRHGLLRDAAYETQVLQTRRDTHKRLAEALITEGAEPGVIALHLELGDQTEQAVAQYIVAAQIAQDSGAHVEASRLTTRALDLILRWPVSRERHLTELTVRLLRALSFSSVRGYAAPEVGHDFEAAEALTRDAGAAPEVMPAIIAIWSYRLVHGEVPAAAGLVSRLVEMSGTEAGAWFAAEIEACAGFQALYEGRLGVATEHLEKSFASFEARPSDNMISEFWPLPNDPLAVSQIGYSCVLALRGDLDGSAEWAERAIERANEVPFPRGPFTLAFVHVYLAWLKWILGDPEGAEEAGQEAVRIGQERGYAYWIALGSVFHGVAEIDIDEFEQTLGTLSLIGHRAFVPAYLGIRATAEGESDPAKAVATLDEAIALAEANGELLHIPELLQLRGLFTQKLGGREPDSVADLSEAVRKAERQESLLIALRAALAVARLPDDFRPSDWRDTLGRQVEALSGCTGLPELDEAASLLA